MATAQAEISGAPGACVATLGPGAASLVNGVANAMLDRVPLLVLTDCLPDGIRDLADHQNLPHDRISGLVAKATLRATAADAGRVVCHAIATAMDGRPGPVHVDISPEVTGQAAVEPAHPGDRQQCCTGQETHGLSPLTMDLLRRTRRPVFLVGLAARTPATASAVRSVASAHHVPVLVTYKAKGIVPDAGAWWAGALTNGALERPVLDRADLFIAVGLDPVELLPRRWPMSQPVISIKTSVP